MLDANVYVSAIIRPEGPPGRAIERFLRDAAFEIVLSPEIVEKTLRALTYANVRKYVRGTVILNCGSRISSSSRSGWPATTR